MQKICFYSGSESSNSDCEDGQFKCVKSGKCIDEKYRCDANWNDCDMMTGDWQSGYTTIKDNSDEECVGKFG